ncbi:cytidine deaminase family protein [Mycolicibacter arupensis]|uniref:cytidine deaminase family protein n=1 Tax=Mycolicibacter arupensis TaxID=342002 RepID=UPI00122D3665|nr:hypothetical protein [Mycolicibacter arupensis]KAA1430706.1 hypothetical protein F0402_12700 [Mycolicibacter arupensis]
MTDSEVDKYRDALSSEAWSVREQARIIGRTKVGCAALSVEGNITSGCNVEHRYRSHDIHAEVNALSSLVARGDSRAVAVLVVAERSKFTPCGSCMDWIFEIGGGECWVGFQPAPEAATVWYQASDLMPHYPN